MLRTYPYLLVAKGKHDNDFFLVTDEESGKKAIYGILRLWNDQGFLGYNYMGERNPQEGFDQDPKFQEAKRLLESDLDLPSARAEAERLITRAEREVREWHKCQELVDMAELLFQQETWDDIFNLTATTVDGRQVNVLRYLLNAYRGSEYQEVYEERFTTPTI